MIFMLCLCFRFYFCDGTQQWLWLIDILFFKTEAETTEFPALNSKMRLWLCVQLSWFLVSLGHFVLIHCTTKECSNYRSCTDKSLYNYSISCLGYESCQSSWLYSNAYMSCHGSASCIDTSEVRGEDDWCFGYFACAYSTNLTATIEILCSAPFSCIYANNARITMDVTPQVFLSGSMSFIHSHFKSPNSYVFARGQNTRSIKMYIRGAFATYGSTIESNGNDLVIYAQGYYSAFGAVINCTAGVQDNCYVYCYGNACVNLTLICPEETTATKICSMTEYDYYNENTTNGTVYKDNYSGNLYKFGIDGMVNKINNMTYEFDTNFSIFVPELNNINGKAMLENKINYNKCNLLAAFDFATYHNSKLTFNIDNNNNDNKNENENNICCIASYACQNASITIDKDSNSDSNSNSNFDYNYNLYCHGLYSCQWISLATPARNVYVEARSGAEESIINFTGMAICSALEGCYNSKINDGKLLVASGYLACWYSKISNVNTIIGIGYGSFEEATITYNFEFTDCIVNDSYNYNNTTDDLDDVDDEYTIYLLSYYAGYQLTINVEIDYDEADFNFDINSTISIENNCLQKITIYCQNYGCLGMKTIIYCGEMNEIGVQKCGLVNQSDTIAIIATTTPPTTTTATVSSTTSTPTPNTESTINTGLSKVVTFLQNITFTVAFSFAIIAVLFMSLSVFLHRKIGSKRKESKIEHLMLQNLSFVELQKPKLNNDSSITSENSTSKNSGSGTGSDGSGNKTDSHTNSNQFVNYTRGYGKNANHFAVLFVLLEIFDLYTDIAYLFELSNDKYNDLFVVFLISMCLTIAFNFLSIFMFVHKEFSTNQLFVNWFYEHNGIIIGLMVLFTLTDVNMITTVFTSQIFGYSIFYSPISINSIKIVQISNFISLFIEHIPQMIVQIIVIFVKSKRFNSIVAATLVVSGIDTIFLLVKAVVWMTLHYHTRKDTEIANK